MEVRPARRTMSFIQAEGNPVPNAPLERQSKAIVRDQKRTAQFHTGTNPGGVFMYVKDIRL